MRNEIRDGSVSPHAPLDHEASSPNHRQGASGLRSLGKTPDSPEKPACLQVSRSGSRDAPSRQVTRPPLRGRATTSETDRRAGGEGGGVGEGEDRYEKEQRHVESTARVKLPVRVRKGWWAGARSGRHRCVFPLGLAAYEGVLLSPHVRTGEEGGGGCGGRTAARGQAYLPTGAY